MVFFPYQVKIPSKHNKSKRGRNLSKTSDGNRIRIGSQEPILKADFQALLELIGAKDPLGDGLPIFGGEGKSQVNDFEMIYQDTR